MSLADIDVDYLRSVLVYDPDTGIFTWKIRSTRKDLIGKPAGNVRKRGYVLIAIHNKKRLAHRLAWLYMTGKEPSFHIDHKNGNPTDNRFSNLREVNRFGNLQNMRGPTKRNKSGYLGVCFHEGKWLVQIMHFGEKIREWGYKTPEEAYVRYLELKRQIHSTCTI